MSPANTDRKFYLAVTHTCRHAVLVTCDTGVQVVEMALPVCVDKDFEPLQQESSDDEETIEKDEKEHKNVSCSFVELSSQNEKLSMLRDHTFACA